MTLLVCGSSGLRGKNRANHAKHGIWFEEAQTVWADSLASEFVDPDHGDDEERFIRVGNSTRDRLLVVVFCERVDGQMRYASSQRAKRRARKGKSMRKEYDLEQLEKRKARAASSPEAAKVQISLRLDGADLSLLKEEAERLGLPYQTLLGSIVHQYVTGELLEKKTVALLKKLSA